MSAWLYLSLGAGVLALLVAFLKASWVKKQDPGDSKLREIGDTIGSGAMASLLREYKMQILIVAAAAVLLVFLPLIFAGFGVRVSMVATFFVRTREGGNPRVALNFGTMGAVILLLALFMANSGGAWDNVKKHIEGGAYGCKGSAAYKAAVIGDTVGDPFKDAAGPAMDIVIKLMSVVSQIIAPMTIRSSR